MIKEIREWNHRRLDRRFNRRIWRHNMRNTIRRYWLAFRILVRFGHVEPLVVIKRYLEHKANMTGRNIDNHAYIEGLVNKLQQRENWDDSVRARDMPIKELPPFNPGEYEDYHGF